MIKTNFNQLFQIEVFHSYFEKNICSCLQFVPSEVTSQIFNRFSFQVRTIAGRTELYINSNISTEALISYIGKNCQPFLDFTIISNDPQFGLYTELPAGALYYDTLSTDNFRQGDVLQLKGQSGAPVMDYGLGRLRVDLKDLLQYCKTGDFSRFSICYQARASQWQYYIINKSAAIIVDPAIAGKSETRFAGPEQILTATGHSAMLFTSTAALLLSEVPSYRFDLVSGATGTALKTIVKGLPIPDVSKLRRYDKQQFFSPMYIYI